MIAARRLRNVARNHAVNCRTRPVGGSIAWCARVNTSSAGVRRERVYIDSRVIEKVQRAKKV